MNGWIDWWNDCDERAIDLYTGQSANGALTINHQAAVSSWAIGGSGAPPGWPFAFQLKAQASPWKCFPPVPLRRCKPPPHGPLVMCVFGFSVATEWKYLPFPIPFSFDFPFRERSNRSHRFRRLLVPFILLRLTHWQTKRWLRVLCCWHQNNPVRGVASNTSYGQTRKVKRLLTYTQNRVTNEDIVRELGGAGRWFDSTSVRRNTTTNRHNSGRCVYIGVCGAARNVSLVECELLQMSSLFFYQVSWHHIHMDLCCCQSYSTPVCGAASLRALVGVLSIEHWAISAESALEAITLELCSEEWDLTFLLLMFWNLKCKKMVISIFWTTWKLTIPVGIFVIRCLTFGSRHFTHTANN